MKRVFYPCGCIGTYIINTRNPTSKLFTCWANTKHEACRAFINWYYCDDYDGSCYYANLVEGFKH